MPGQHALAPHDAHGQDVHPIAGVSLWHVPAAQIWPGAQTTPQLPQYGSPASSVTHALLPPTSHAVSGAVHAPAEHAPFSHFSPAAHGVAPHAPQWSGSEPR